MMREWCQAWSLLPPYRYEGSKPVTRKVAYTRGKEDCQKKKRKKKPGQTLRITSDAHWWSWIQQKPSITTWTPIQQKSRINASPPWTDHLCTIKFCRHTYICSDNQDLQTQLPKSNQNSDGKPFGNIPSEPVAGRVTHKNSRDFTCAELLYYILFCILQFLNIRAFGFLKQPQSLHISSLLPHLPAPANTEWSFDNGSCTHTHTYKTAHNRNLYHQAMASNCCEPKDYVSYCTRHRVRRWRQRCSLEKS